MNERDVALLVISIEITLFVVVSWMLSQALVFGTRRERMTSAAVLLALLSRWIGERVKRRAQALVVLAVYAAAIPLSIIPFALVVAFGLRECAAGRERT